MFEIKTCYNEGIKSHKKRGDSREEAGTPFGGTIGSLDLNYEARSMSGYVAVNVNTASINSQASILSVTRL